MSEARELSGARDAFPQIPGYRIEETLGRGSTGVVFRATQLAVDRQVALKVLRVELAGRAKAVRRLQREARTAAKLSHPHIVQAIDMGESDGLWWYAMELIDGESLSERLGRGRLSEREALRLFIPLVEALDHAFEHGVVHRDIKPANILIDRSNRARLVDLGLAFAEDDPLLTRPGGTLGTPHYVSPEQARNPQAADVRSDIWSLGATLYHAVSGRPPFSGESVAEILSGVLYARVPDPEELDPPVSRDLSLVLRKCLSREPERRYQSPRELLEDLELLRERRHVSVRPGSLDPVQSRGDKRRKLSILAGVALLLACVLGAWAVWGTPDGSALQEPRAEQRWEPLEQIAQRLHQPEVLWASALTELEALGPPPEAFRTRYEDVRLQLTAAFRDATARLAARLRSDFERHVQERDLLAAQELLGEALDVRVRRELNPSEEQMREVRPRLQVEELRMRLDVELESAFSTFTRRLAEHYTLFVDAKVEYLRRKGDWRGARAELLLPVETRLQEARISLLGLPQKRVADVLQARRDTNAAELASLDAAWRALDAGLAERIEARAAEIRRELEQRTQARPAREELEELLQAGLRELELRPDSMLTEISDQARKRCEQCARELTDLAAALLLEDAHIWLGKQVQELEPLWRERRYAEIVEAWERNLQHPFAQPVRDAALVEQRCAELLQQMLQSAERSVLALDGKTARILIGTIVYAGSVDAGPDPLRKGFRLRTGDTGTQLLALRVPDSEPRGVLLGPDAVEQLAGLPADAAAISDPLQRMTKALFRYREGDVDGAARALPLQAPAQLEWLPVAEEITRLVRQSANVAAAELESRERQARALLNLVFREGHLPSVDTQVVVRNIDQLLAQYDDLALIRERKEELRKLRERLSAGPTKATVADLEAAYGPSSLALASQRATLLYDFNSDLRSPFTRGEWLADLEGWVAPAPRSREQLSDESLWPRLPLGAPADLDANMTLELDLVQPQESGEPQLLVISLAGVHVALRGASERMPPRVLLGSGGPQAFLALLDEALLDQKGVEFPGLQRGERHSLRIELSQKRGVTEVHLDGKQILRQDAPRPDDRPGNASLLVRSLEPVKLLAAKLTVRYR